MLSPCTIHNARQVATSLTEAKREARAKSSHYPLGQLTDRLEVGAPMLKRSVNYEGYEKLTQRFKEVNEVTSAQSEEFFRDLVKVTSDGVNNMLHLSRNVVVPLIKRCAQDVQYYFEDRHPELKIQPVSLTPLLQSDVLLQHLQDYPKQYGVKEEYKTFILAPPTIEQLREWAAQTPHIESDLIKRWLGKVEDEDLLGVFSTLFNDKRVLNVDDLYFARPHTLVWHADLLLFAYFLTSYLRDNPQDTVDDGASLAEWETALGDLHGYMGLRLIELNERRARLKREGRLVLNYDDRVAGDGMHVYINPDLVDEWQAKGGTAGMLLAAGYVDPMLTRIDALMAEKDALEAFWARKHKALKMHSNAANKANRRGHYRMIMETTSGDGEDGLPKVGHDVWKERLNDSLAALSEDDMEKPYYAITELVCDCYFPGTAIKDFLRTMERCGVDIHAREAATFATVEVLASWMAEQIKVEAVELDLAGEENGKQVLANA
jgi:hypothetical protein